MTALSAPVAVALTAFAVDQGSLFTERRATQSLADLAAITAAANMDKTEAAVLATLLDNGMSSVTVNHSDTFLKPATGKPVVKIVQGRYTANAAAAVGNRFEAGKQPFNAVKVSLFKTGTLYFGSALMDPPVIGTTAIANTTPQATFSIGSRLLKFNTADSPLLNGLLGGLLGTSISLDAMDYNALISADVSVLSFLDQLAVKLSLTGVSYSEVLASKATLAQILGAMADIPGLDSQSRLALHTMAAGAANTVKIPLSQIIDLGTVGQLGLGQRPAGLTVDASAFSLLSAAAALANGSKQIAVDTGINVPGLVNVQLLIAIGEPPQSSPWLTVGEEGAIVRTAQTRLKLVVNIGSSKAGVGINLISVFVPLNVEVAYAEAKLTDISCPTGRPESRKVTIAARPGIAEVYLAQNDSSDFADFTRKQSFSQATVARASIDLLLLKIRLLELKAMAHAEMGNTSTTNLVFNDADITAKRIQTVTTKDYTQSLTSSLLNDLQLTPYVLGVRVDLIDLVFAPLRSAIMPLLSSVTSQLDPIVYKLLSALGIGLGQADVRVTGATCGRSVLVQ